MQSLPAFSPVASRLLSMATGSQASLREVSGLIEMDPALSVDVLRLINSPLYARRIEITGVMHATTLLGMEAIRGMVLTVALRNFSRLSSGAPVFRQCWRHNLACALLTADLAAVSGIDRDAAYSLGLLHDSGRLALLAASPVGYSRLLDSGAADLAELMEKERELFEMDHCDVGLWLAEEWRLPIDFQNAMSNHHEPGGGDGSHTSLIVHLACDLATMAGFPSWGRPREWDTTELQQRLPEAGPSILDSGELIPRLAEGINSLECSLSL